MLRETIVLFFGFSSFSNLILLQLEFYEVYLNCSKNRIVIFYFVFLTNISTNIEIYLNVSR